ncbi:MAG: MFS transporter, partial [Lachnospiraceae bacterium]|nr:MFS transporter [Lachnospiraceae bacterium]
LMYGFGYGGFYTLLNVAAVRGTNAGNRGVANSIFFGSKDVGTAVGSLAWGAIMMLGYPVMYGIAALVILLLAVLYIYLGEQNREEKIKGACLKAGASER